MDDSLARICCALAALCFIFGHHSLTYRSTTHNVSMISKAWFSLDHNRIVISYDSSRFWLIVGRLITYDSSRFCLIVWRLITLEGKNLTKIGFDLDFCHKFLQTFLQ